MRQCTRTGPEGKRPWPLRTVRRWFAQAAAEHLARVHSRIVLSRPCLVRPTEVAAPLHHWDTWTLLDQSQGGNSMVHQAGS